MQNETQKRYAYGKREYTAVGRIHSGSDLNEHPMVLIFHERRHISDADHEGSLLLFSPTHNTGTGTLSCARQFLDLNSRPNFGT